MHRQPFPDEIAKVEDLVRLLGPTVTVDLQPTDRWLSGELWTVHKRVGGQLGIGQGASLGDALQDLHAVAAPAKREAA